MSPTGYIIIVLLVLSIIGLGGWRHQIAVSKCHATAEELKVLTAKVKADTEKAKKETQEASQRLTEAQKRSNARRVVLTSKTSTMTAERLTAYFQGVGP